MSNPSNMGRPDQPSGSNPANINAGDNGTDMHGSNMLEQSHT
jgi:hypothetical protein